MDLLCAAGSEEWSISDRVRAPMLTDSLTVDTAIACGQYEHKAIYTLMHLMKFSKAEGRLCLCVGETVFASALRSPRSPAIRRAKKARGLNAEASLAAACA